MPGPVQRAGGGLMSAFGGKRLLNLMLLEELRSIV
jgi:hypothetical protein